MASAAETKRLREEAWVGDAVLTLFAREYILATDGKADAAKQARMTSNHFLSAFGEPTAVEARIGRIYQQQGAEAAHAWIRSELLPRFDRDEQKKALARHGGNSPATRSAPSRINPG